MLRNNDRIRRRVKRGEREIAADLAGVLRVVLAALEVYAQGGNAKALRAVPSPTAPPTEPPEVTEEHRQRAEAILRRAGILS